MRRSDYYLSTMSPYRSLRAATGGIYGFQIMQVVSSIMLFAGQELD